MLRNVNTFIVTIMSHVAGKKQIIKNISPSTTASANNESVMILGKTTSMFGLKIYIFCLIVTRFRSADKLFEKVQLILYPL